MAVVAEPVRAFAAVKVTLYGVALTWALVGVQLKVPLVLPAPAVNVAPVGSVAAVSEVIASPSGSAAVTVKVISVLDAPVAVAGAVTTGARSTLVIVMFVVAEPV